MCSPAVTGGLALAHAVEVDLREMCVCAAVPPNFQIIYDSHVDVECNLHMIIEDWISDSS